MPPFTIPIPYWLERMLRSLIESVDEPFPILAPFSNPELLGILVTLSVLFGAISVFVFRAFDRRARQHGLINRTRNNLAFSRDPVFLCYVPVAG